ncbi:MAG: hypothetical protein A7316_03135 [Candidatus Altiarchaeales archaeon WOR_SM1_86-2]|nr:MAG: hypothetical protein A7316_03135 [Candidatus Altiarchaeales archaeon WOR_SM1_86-2]
MKNFWDEYKKMKYTKYEDIINRHIHSLEFLREEFSGMDNLTDLKVIMGIRDWDDSACVKFGGKKLVASVDGPYKKRLVMKSALIHASTDVVVKGAVPLFALDTLIGGREDIEEMAASLRVQSEAMKIPILGGNTMFEENAKPRANLAVIGELMLDEPIRDCGAKKGDKLMLIGEPIWGDQEERIEKAKRLFFTWFEILSAGVKVNASKDVTKGGLISTIYEISEKSGAEFEIRSIDAKVHLTRNLDNFLISLDAKECERVLDICKRNDCHVSVLN